MESGIRNIARVVRMSGVVGAGVILVMGIYLPLADSLDWALLPFLFAFVPFAIADIAAGMIDDGAKTGAIFSRSRSHPLR
jgi:hypothetical protein